jgi:CRISPR/Cas system Type II protein with McrA/HNH and RuvC-like nuclease domain
VYNPNKVKLSLVGATTVVKLYIGFDGKCAGCDKQYSGLMTWQLDHLIPQSYFRNRGLKVDNSIDNLALVCPVCNIGKRDKECLTFFGKARMAKIAKSQQRAKDASLNEVEQVARRFAIESKKFGKLYKGGKFSRLFVPEEEEDEV